MPEPQGGAQFIGSEDNPTSGGDLFDTLDEIYQFSENPAFAVDPQELESDDPERDTPAATATDTPPTEEPTEQPATADGEEPVAGEPPAVADPTAAIPDQDVDDPSAPEDVSAAPPPGMPSSRRGAWKALTQANEALEKATTRITELEKRPVAPVVDDALVRRECVDFLGMAPPVDEQGRPTGEESLYQRLHRQATSPQGIEFEDEQKQYAELVQRGAMAGKLFGIAKQQAWAEVASDLEDAELGINEEAVKAAGSISGWRSRYRQAVESRVAAGHQAEIASLKAGYDRQIKELSDKLQLQSASHQSQLARAQTVRAPIAAGRPTNSRTTLVSPPQSSSGADLVSELASAFAEADRDR